MSIIPIPVDPIAPFHVGDALVLVDVLVEMVNEFDEALELDDATYSAVLAVPGADGVRDLAVVRDEDVLVLSDVLPVGDTILVVSGVIEIRVARNGVRLAPILVVVEDDSPWLSLASARAEWADAPTSDVSLWRLLDAAREAVENFAPKRKVAAVRAGAPLPSSWEQAQLMHARAIRTASRADQGDTLGAEGFTVRVFPLDWNIQQLIRPKRGTPVIR